MMETKQPVFRAPMRAQSLQADPYAGAGFAVARSLAGMGEPLSRRPDDLEDALLLTAEEHGPKSERMLRRFVELPEETLLWTRTGEGEFRLGRLSGDWVYETPEEALQTGICQVRPCRWLDEEFDHLAVPQAVALTFSRGGRNFQRIRDREAENNSISIWRSGQV